MPTPPNSDENLTGPLNLKMFSRQSMVFRAGRSNPIGFLIITIAAAMSLLYFGVRGETSQKRPLQSVSVFAITALLLSGAAYTLVAFANNGLMRPLTLLSWLSSYGEGGTLPMWGKWELSRIAIAVGSALRSVLPVPLAVPISEIGWSVQRGRVAVDLALLGFFALVAPFWFVIAYCCFMPFIVWWDPYEPKWFLIPNIFAFGFFACALQPWLSLNVVNNFGSIKEWSQNVRNNLGTVYITDPN